MFLLIPEPKKYYFKLAIDLDTNNLQAECCCRDEKVFRFPFLKTVIFILY